MSNFHNSFNIILSNSLNISMGLEGKISNDSAMSGTGGRKEFNTHAHI